MKQNLGRIIQLNLKIQPHRKAQLLAIQKYEREFDPGASMTQIVELMIDEKYRRLKLSDKDVDKSDEDRYE